MPVAGGGATLLARTLERLQHVAPAEHAYVVTGRDYAERILRESPGLDAERVLVEPAPLDSGPAIALAAAVIAHRHPGSVMGSFAADHHIPDEDLFADALRTAVRGAERDLLMTIGVEPTRPDTGYGYIQYDPESATDGVYAVDRFKEKPSAEVAAEFLRTGGFLWNASMFVWRPEAFLEVLREHAPTMHDGVAGIAAAWDGPRRDEVLAETWPTLDRIAVEYAVMEPAAADGRVGTVRGRFGWTDVGDFNSLGALGRPDAAGNTDLGPAEGDFLLHDGRNLVLHAPAGKTVAVVGAEDLAIVDTGDVLLVCARDRVQDVKAVVDALEARSRDDLL